MRQEKNEGLENGKCFDLVLKILRNPCKWKPIPQYDLCDTKATI